MSDKYKFKSVRVIHNSPYSNGKKIIAMLQLEELLLLCYFGVAFNIEIMLWSINVAYLESDKINMIFVSDIFLIQPEIICFLF